jgi:hypothetical protein
MDAWKVVFRKAAKQVFLSGFVASGRFVAAGPEHAADRFSAIVPLGRGGGDSGCLELFRDPPIQFAGWVSSGHPIEFEPTDEYRFPFLEEVQWHEGSF